MNDRLLVGQKLTNGQKLVSPNQRFELVMQNDGNVVLYDKVPVIKALWSTKTSKHGSGHDYTFVLQPDRHIVLYKGVCIPANHIWASRTNKAGYRSIELVLKDDGNLEGHTSEGMFWQTKTNKKVRKAEKKAKRQARGNYNAEYYATRAANDRMWADLHRREAENKCRYIESQLQVIRTTPNHLGVDRIAPLRSYSSTIRRY